MARQSLSSIGGWVARLDDEAAARAATPPRPGPRWRRRCGCWTTSTAGGTPSPGSASRRPSRRGGGAPLPVLAQQGVADAVVDGAVLVGPGPPVVGLLDIAAAAQDGPHGQVVAPGLGVNAADPWPAPEHLAGHQRTAAVPIPAPRWPSATRRSQLGSPQVPRSSTRSRPTTWPSSSSRQAREHRPQGPSRPPSSAASVGPSRARTWNGHWCSLRNRARASRSAAVTAPECRLGHGRMVAGCATMSRMSTTAPTRERTHPGPTTSSSRTSPGW